jgi:hypothetical protein
MAEAETTRSVPVTGMIGSGVDGETILSPGVVGMTDSVADMDAIFCWAGRGMIGSGEERARILLPATMEMMSSAADGEGIRCWVGWGTMSSGERAETIYWMAGQVTIAVGADKAGTPLSIVKRSEAFHKGNFPPLSPTSFPLSLSWKSDTRGLTCFGMGR